MSATYRKFMTNLVDGIEDRYRCIDGECEQLVRERDDKMRQIDAAAAQEAKGE